MARRKGQPIGEYLPRRALMALWTAGRLGVSPASRVIRELDDWQMGLVYEAAMSYPLDGLRRAFRERLKSPANFDEEDLLDMGYSRGEIAAIRKG